jgi:RNA polymerase sigma factor (sigma-70 family)
MGGNFMPTVHSSTDHSSLIIACSETVRKIAWRFARSSDGRIDADEMYSIGMLEICEAVAAGRVVNANNPVAYLCGAARLAMAREWRRVYDHACVSLDAPLTSNPGDESFSLVDLVAAPSSAGLVEVTQQERAVQSALRRLSSPKQRAALKRRYGLSGGASTSLKETANSLGATVSQVDGAVRRGLRELRNDARLCKAVGVEVAGVAR